MRTTIVKLAFNNARSKLAETLYVKTGVDFSRPVQITGLLNKRCNAKCRMCEERKNLDMPELPAEAWNRGLESLRKFVGTYHINFSGGEPLIKKDVFDILNFCRDRGISCGVTTNGWLLNEKNVARLVAARLTNVNISVDSMRDEVHDDIRGLPGSLQHIKDGLVLLDQEQQRAGHRCSVVLKTIVARETLDSLCDVADYARQMKLTGVMYQPIMVGSDECDRMFQVDKPLLNATIDKLVAMKKAGAPIMNSVDAMLDWRPYFDGVTSERNAPCAVALRNLTIAPNGDVNLCPFCNSRIGNIEHDELKVMWYSPKARKLRHALVNCKQHCTAACVVKRSLKDYADIFFRLMRAS